MSFGLVSKLLSSRLYVLATFHQTLQTTPLKAPVQTSECRSCVLAQMCLINERLQLYILDVLCIVS